jgi:choline dehydrogenase-like flavoprotein
MLSGIGNQADLQRLGIPVAQHLPGVGQNFQDHLAIGCIWEYQQPLPPRNNAGEAMFFWKSDPGLPTPDLQTCQAEIPMCSAETAASHYVGTTQRASSKWRYVGCPAFSQALKRRGSHRRSLAESETGGDGRWAGGKDGS